MKKLASIINNNGISDICECLSDCSGDGLVNVLDLLIIVNQYGSSGNDLQADVTYDQHVNTLDLLIVISGFGVCP